MNYEKMEAGPEMDYLIGVKVMGFMTAKFFKHGGCYPADAKPINEKDAWGATSKGGTYPFLTKDGCTVFRGVQGGFGETWAPSVRIGNAFEVAEEVRLFEETRLDRLYRGVYRITSFTKAGNEFILATGPTAPLAICRAVLVKMSSKVKKVS
jgi:hypothetical protein